ncbi:LacI family DNA-binding transcriptional regulator [Kineosporia sp. R_H_3]|uniref:LacI family DNA-binding transcriptional regulator n=1 Tax=Kineosporia sp. R_H_3 TaxID=1961848 RepID=UPI000B4BD56B|nr:LacI family DNA-binding transcriptional regulator [Kineosporia sp. R_H_3]
MRRPTMDDVAQRAGVSRALVSLVMRESPKVSPERRAAVLAAAADLGYSPHAMARQLAQRTSTVLAVLVSDLHNPYFADIVESVDTAAREAGLDMILSTGGRRPAGERRAVETMLGFRPAGLVLLSPVVPQAVLEAASVSTPVVAVERTVALPGVDTVTDDGRAGSRLAVDHLVGLGHRDVVHLDGGQGAQSSTRRRGFVDAMRAHGLEPRVEPSEYTEEGGAAAVARLLAAGTRFTALVAANDINAIGALSALADAGLRVPEDVSVVGYDNTSLAAMRHVGLTTVDQPRAEMGRLAVAAVVERIAGRRTTPTRHRLQPSLVVRTTTAPPPRR